MALKYVCRLNGRTGALPKPPKPGYVYSVPVLTSVQFQIPAGKLMNKESSVFYLKYSDDEPQSFVGSKSPLGHWVIEITFESPGSYRFWVACQNEKTHEIVKGTDNWVVVEPVVCVKGEELDLSAICMQTVLSRNLGTIDRWVSVLKEQGKLGFNMIHLTPIQVLGFSHSLYSLADCTKLNPELIPGETEEEQASKLLSVVTELDDSYGVGCLVDIILNHCAAGSEFIEEHPEAAYNLSNCPHHHVTYELDEGLWDFSVALASKQVQGYNGNRIENEEDLRKILEILRNRVIPGMKLEEFFLMKTDEVMKSFNENEENVEISQDLCNEFTGQGVERFLSEYCVKSEGEARFGTHIDFATLLTAANTQNYSLSKLKQELPNILNSINSQQTHRYKSHLADILRNIENDVRYHKLTLNEKTITHKFPLVKRYFWKCRSGESVLFNGFIMGYTQVLKDFAEKEGWHYLRRNVVIWDDSVKLRYGRSKEDCPALWGRMETYITNMARVFKGFRLDNAHSTPVHVCEYYLAMARKINPNLLVMAELFTSDAEMDAFYVKKLGINMLIREAMQAGSPQGLGGQVYNFGKGDTSSVGSLEYTDLNNRSVLGLRNECGHVALRASIVPPLYYDCTHDNETPNQKGRAVDALPNMALVAMTNCAIASTRGYDELIPTQLSVVKENRLYQFTELASFERVTVFGEGEVEQLIVFEDGGRFRKGQVKGEWNGWTEATTLQKVGDSFGVILKFSNNEKGRQFMYKFITDDEWMHSARAPCKQEGHNVNNYFVVGGDPVLSPGIYRNLFYPREILNRVHYRMAVEGYNEIYVHQWTDDTIMVIRQQPSTHDSYVLIVRTAYNPSEGPIELKGVRLPGVLENIELIAQLTLPSSHYTKDPEFVTGLVACLKVSGSIEEYGRIHRESDSSIDSLSFHNLPVGFALLLKTKLQDSHVISELNVKYTELSRYSNCKYLFSEITLEQVNHMLWRCSKEELEISRNSRDVYGIPGYKTFKYAGIGSLLVELLPLSSVNNLGHAIFNNIREGDWLIDYIILRLSSYSFPPTFTGYFISLLSAIKSLPTGIKPKHVSKAIILLFRNLKLYVLRDLFPCALFSSLDDSLSEVLGLAVTQFWGDVPSARSPLFPCSLSAGLPHFSTEYTRVWGRDTFIALRGLFLCTGRYSEAKETILLFSSVLRHGLIPNLLDSCNNPRYNARDATWFYLQAVQDYIKAAPEGHRILREKVTLKWESNEAVELQGVIQRIMQAHASGIQYREWNAGTQIDAHMTEQGFNVEIKLDRSTGFIFGGNKWNCGTWMDKMGSSAKAKNKGVPATPRNGAPIELTGLLYSALLFLNELHENALFQWSGVETEGAHFTWKQWAEAIEQHFEESYYLHRGAYKDTVGAGEREDAQIRPNMCIAMAVAPGIFDAQHAVVALKTVKRLLMPGKKQLGIKTLSPEDEKYIEFYDNSDDSNNGKIAHGFSYHNGPEWVWPVGFFLRALAQFKVKPKEKIMKYLGVYRSYLDRSEWMSVPELTNAGGEECSFSCPAQAWSVSCLLEVLHLLGDS